MGRSIALLRGVNVGGIRLKMAEVADCVREAGFENVRTVLASGNVLVDSRRAPATDKRAIESALRERFAYEAWVHVLRLDELREIVDRYPFETDREGWHDYVIVCARPELASELADLASEDAATGSAPEGAAERSAMGAGVVYWTVPKGETLTSPIGRVTSRARFTEWTTTRNLRTLRTLLA